MSNSTHALVLSNAAAYRLIVALSFCMSLRSLARSTASSPSRVTVTSYSSNFADISSFKLEKKTRKMPHRLKNDVTNTFAVSDSRQSRNKKNAVCSSIQKIVSTYHGRKMRRKILIFRRQLLNSVSVIQLSTLMSHRFI